MFILAVDLMGMHWQNAHYPAYPAIEDYVCAAF